MAVTCEQVAALLTEEGASALAKHPDAQAHIGECEACADRLIELESPAGSLADTPAVPTAAQPAELPVSLAPAPVPKPTAPPVTSSEPGPLEPMSWLPSELPPVADTDAGFGGRREYIRIKPTHLALVAVGSAIIGGLVVLATALLVQPTWSPMSSELAPSGEEVSLDLVPAFSVDEDGTDSGADYKSKRSGKKRKRKEKHERRPATAVTPSTADISTGIKANLAKLGSCFRAARKRQELTPGRHPLVVDFRILPNGSVQDAALTGPDYLTDKRIAKCVATKLRTWRFPASAKGSPVRNLHLPIKVK